jgi:hypothetical protein
MLVTRNFVITAFGEWFNYYVTRYFVSGGMVPGVFGRVIIPMAVFGWKRALYILHITTMCHDSPWKGHAYINFILDTLLSLNIGVTMQQIGVTSWSAVTTFVIMDWLIYALRVIIVARFGMKQCPKLITYLVEKQLENLPSPLLQHVESKGEKTAMRVDQAFIALMEGESMTVNFILHFINYAVVWGIFRNDDLIAVVPLRSGLILVFYSGLDFIQDVLADHIGSKFNYWSYLYKLGGWTSKQMFLFQMWQIMSYGSTFLFYFQIKPQTFDHVPNRMPVPTEWYFSIGGVMHL